VRIATSFVAYFFISVCTSPVCGNIYSSIAVALLHPPQPCVPAPLRPELW
jgi:hypothetical protein